MFGKLNKASCSKAQPLLSPYMDGRLDAGEQKLVEEHIKTCDRCRHELASLQMTVRLLHRVPAVASPRSFAVTTDMLRRPVRQLSLLWLRPATALAFAILLFLSIADMFQVFELPSAQLSPAAPQAPAQPMLVTPGAEGAVERAVLPEPSPTPLAAPRQPKPMTRGAQDMSEKAVTPELSPAPLPVPEQPKPMAVATPEPSPQYPTPPPQVPQPWISFWLHQMEIAFAVLVLILGSLLLFALSRGRRGAGQ